MPFPPRRFRGSLPREDIRAHVRVREEREREKGLPISTFLEEAGKGGDLKKLFGQKYGWNSVEVGIDRAC